MKRRFVTLVMALSLALSLAAPAGAAVANEPLATKIENDMNSMAAAYLNTDNITISSIGEDDSITYAYALTDEVTNYVTVQDNADGSVVLDVREGDLQDTITIDENGDLWVNDMKVEPTGSVVETVIMSGDSGIMPRVAMQYDYSGSNFSKAAQNGSYNSSAAYVYYNANLYLGGKILEMTGTAIGTILAQAIAPDNTYVADLLSSACGSIAASLKTAAGNLAYDSNSISYRITVYGHPINDSFESYWKHSGKYYPGYDYGGSPVSKTFYEKKFYYA